MKELIDYKDVDETFPHALQYLSDETEIRLVFRDACRVNGEAHYGPNGSCINVWRDLCLLALAVCESPTEGEENG